MAKDPTVGIVCIRAALILGRARALLQKCRAWAGLCAWATHTHVRHARVCSVSTWWWAARVEFVFPFLKELEIAFHL